MKQLSVLPQPIRLTPQHPSAGVNGYLGFHNPKWVYGHGVAGFEAEKAWTGALDDQILPKGERVLEIAFRPSSPGVYMFDLHVNHEHDDGLTVSLGGVVKATFQIKRVSEGQPVLWLVPLSFANVLYRVAVTANAFWMTHGLEISNVAKLP